MYIIYRICIKIIEFIIYNIYKIHIINENNIGVLKNYKIMFGDRAERHDILYDFGYSFPLFSSLLKKEEDEKENELAKIVIKSHAFLLNHFWIEQKGMTFDYDFGYSFPPLSSLLKKRGKKKSRMNYQIS